MLVNLAAIICLLSISIVLLRGSKYLIKNAGSKFNRILLSREYFGLKPGDILLFTSNVHNFTNSFLTMNFFSHVGILTKNGDNNDGDDSLYISETNGPIRINRKGGAYIFPLLFRLKHYDGNIYLMRLNKELDKDRLAILQDETKQVIGHPYPSLKTKALSSLGISDNSRHCFQHVGHILKKLNLIPENTDLGLVSSTDLSSLYEVPLEDGYKYSYPEQLVYDIVSFG
jgi:hypothetical protein